MGQESKVINQFNIQLPNKPTSMAFIDETHG